MRPTGPGCREPDANGQGKGVKHQGLADRHRYQARPRSDGQGSPRDRVGTEPSPSLGPRRGGAPSGMARAHGPATAAVVRGKQKPRPRNQHSPAHGGRAARTPQLPAPRMGVVDDRTTEARARRAQQSGAGRELTPRGCGRLNWPHLHPSMPIADRHDRGHRISPRAAIGSPPGGDLNRGFDLGHREQKWGMRVSGTGERP